ncbi:uncharacterized protein VTP21DRAFT_10382 [Calcarisporiella thermophila]|uniref:uncharacterized protein n=1 Tax=Calcarisporiella thermophila TaxID=911321 RepID=UPI0037428525
MLGVTPPISLNGPTDIEKQISEQLVECLKSHKIFESDQEARTREIVLGKLYQIVKDFVYRVSLKRKLPEAIAREAGGKIFTSGSYRLGVHNAGGDIDTVCVVPKHVQREDFFSDMFEMLSERPEVMELTSVEDAFVPVIKMQFQGIPIDFLFAQLAIPSVPDTLDLADNNILKNLDERCVRSLNGPRVTDDILRLVPVIPEFRMALRCIKLWAKKRAIYSNVNGFLGGVAYAILVARICQLYPNANAGTIVSKFFRIFYQWQWPQPVMLKPIEDGPLQVRVWNPKLYPTDKAHRMPIITPAYPSMCATHNVTHSTLTVMKSEFKRAMEITDRLMIGAGKWEELFEKSDFFHRYRNYLQVIAASGSEEKQLRWSGFVESRIRQLVMKLEIAEGVLLAHPYVTCFDKIHYCANDEEATAAASGETVPGTKNMPKSKEEGKEDAERIEKEGGRIVYTSTFYIGLCIEPKTAATKGTRKLDLSWQTSDFVRMVKGWDRYEEGEMSIVLRHIKSSALPDDLFEPGEVRTPRRKKASLKRNAADGVDTPNKRQLISPGKEKEPQQEDPEPSPDRRTEAVTGVEVA